MNNDRYFKLMDETISIGSESEGAEYLDHDETLRVIKKIARAHKLPLNFDRWWRVRQPDIMLEPQDNANWIQYFKNIENSIDDEFVYFVVADDNLPKDWHILKICSKDIYAIYDKYEWGFEYIIFSFNFKWCVIDSNSYCISVFGDLQLPTPEGFIAHHLNSK